MKSHKLVSIFALALVVLMAFTACGGTAAVESTPPADSSAPEAVASEAAPSESDTAQPPPAEPTAGDGVALEMWSWSPIPRTADKMVAAFNEETPDISVNITMYNYNPEYLAALSAGAAANNLPDIIGLQPGSLTQQYRDYLIPVETYAEASWGADWMDKFSKISADQIKLGNPAGNDSVYIIPIESQVIYIVYNKQMFDELGIAKPATYEDLKAACAKLVEAGKAPFWLGGADGWQNINLYLMLISQVDTEIFDKAQNGEVAWTEPAFVQAMNNYKKMFDDGIFQVGAMSNTSYPQGVNALTSGGTGMVALGSWWFQEFTAEDPAQTVKDWVSDGFYLPAVEAGLNDSAPIGGVDFGYGITANCQNPDAAWKAIESFASGAGIQACVDDLNNLAAFKGIEPKAENIPDHIKEQLAGYAADLETAMNQRIGEPTIDQALQDALAAVATGEMDAEAAMAKVQEAQDALK